jgi:hypothetical protein
LREAEHREALVLLVAESGSDGDEFRVAGSSGGTRKQWRLSGAARTVCYRATTTPDDRRSAELAGHLIVEGTVGYSAEEAQDMEELR